MKYIAARFAYTFPEEWQRDVFIQQLADIGFDSFEDDKAYIPASLYDADTLSQTISKEKQVRLIDIQPCEDCNWNAVWESEHPRFEIELTNRLTGKSATVVITPHCAFGAGSHETTSMMLDELQRADSITLHSTLDNGCGTGILAIAARKLGAKNVTAIDIDEKSVQNTRENAMQNNADITVLQGSNPPVGQYSLIMSNIHRNILIDQMPLYAQYLTRGGELWLSGFTLDDCPMLTQKAVANGLVPAKCNHVTNKGDWAMLKFTKLI